MPELHKKQKALTKQELRNKIIEWNNKYPIDYYWRSKHNIPFGSVKHKEITFVEQVIDYEEDKLMREYKENLKNENSSDSEYSQIEGKKIVEMSTKEIDAEFDNLDISQYRDKPDIEEQED